MKAKTQLYRIGILALVAVMGGQLIRSLIGDSSVVTQSAGEVSSSQAAVHATDDREVTGASARRTLLGPAKQFHTGNSPPIGAATSAASEPDRANARTPILRQLGSADPGERVAALFRLNGFHKAEAIEILADVLAHDDNPDVRRGAIRVLGQMGGDEAVWVMATTALSDRDAYIRYYALESLSMSGSYVVDFLGQAMFGDPDPEVRRLVLLLLAKDSNPAASALVQAAMSDEDEEVRHTATLIAETRPPLPMATADEADALRQLSWILARDQDASRRVEAVNAIASLGGDDAWDLLETAMADSDAGVRYQAIAAMADSGGSVTQLLSQVMFGDPDAGLRRYAVELLGEDANPAVMAMLQAVAEGEDEEVSPTAHAVLELWLARAGTDIAAVPSLGEETALAELHAGPERELREWLGKTLFLEPIFAIQDAYALDDVEMSQILGKMLSSDEDVYAREDAIKVLAEIGGDAARNAIASALGDNDVIIRQQAVETLWDSGGPNIPLVGQALFGDPDPGVRGAVVRLLAADGGPAAMALLKAASEDSDENVRLLARESMGRYSTY